jgi:hypothetical protein
LMTPSSAPSIELTISPSVNPTEVPSLALQPSVAPGHPTSWPTDSSSYHLHWIQMICRVKKKPQPS